MIIGLTGLKNSGKDTVGAYLVKNHGFERRAFADPGKRYLAAALDVSLIDIENYKNLEEIKVSVGYKNEPTRSEVLECGHSAASPMPLCPVCNIYMNIPDYMWSPIRERTFREFMREFIESAKVVFGHDFWVDQALPVDGFYSGRAIVITDLRFQSEAYRIRLLEGNIIRIKRGVTLEEDLHVSEVEQLNIVSDHDIYNDGTVEELFEQVEDVLTQIG